jgi:cbb3-type cytochrome oxidase subunit 1
MVFAFGGNALIATSFYVVQRTCRTRLALENLAWFVFWGYRFLLCWPHRAMFSASPSLVNMLSRNGMLIFG